MLKYLNTQICLTEIPDEISLGISVLGCNVHCTDCHSKHIWDVNSENKGICLTEDEIDKLIESNPFITCVLFFGGEWDLEYLENIIKYIRKKHKLKVALYSGQETRFFKKTTVTQSLNYLKTGPYIKKLGGLRSINTNQQLYSIEPPLWVDITYKFRRNEN
jgi:anaerobic ribonucleoside-triphosphate reductase activating protein